MKPMDIEKKSFEIITKELGSKKLDPKNELIIKRVIHTSADFEYADTLCFSKDVVDIAVDAIKKGATIVTDTQMVKAGINKRVLGSFGGSVECFIADEDVAKEAKEKETTRSAISMEKASNIKGDVIFAIGNAPTALMKIKELYDMDKINPVLVIGTPVGFVNVVESKEMIIDSKINSIVSKGRKGGSNIAAAICNALLYIASNNQR